MEATMKLSEKKSMTPAAKERRKAAIQRLEKQLSEGTKPNKSGNVPANVKEIPDKLAKNLTITNIKKHYPEIPLTPNDIGRINREIEVLKTRI